LYQYDSKTLLEEFEEMLEESSMSPITPPAPICECGIHSAIGQGAPPSSHSDWCPMYNIPNKKSGECDCDVNKKVGRVVTDPEVHHYHCAYRKSKSKK